MRQIWQMLMRNCACCNMSRDIEVRTTVGFRPETLGSRTWEFNDHFCWPPFSEHQTLLMCETNIYVWQGRWERFCLVPVQCVAIHYNANCAENMSAVSLLTIACVQWTLATSVCLCIPWCGRCVRWVRREDDVADVDERWKDQPDSWKSVGRGEEQEKTSNTDKTYFCCLSLHWQQLVFANCHSLSQLAPYHLKPKMCATSFETAPL